MIVLDTTIVNVALPSIRADLGFSETSLAWVVNAYLLTFGGFLLLGGRLGDLYGHRRMFLIGIALFTARLDRLRARRLAGVPDRGARRAGARRRDRLGRLAVADDEPVHRAGRARQGDGHLRLRRRRRRQHRRAARRRPHRRARLALDLPRQRADRHRRLRRLAQAAPDGPRRRLGAAARRRRRGHRHGGAHARRLRDRQRQRGGLDVDPDARPAGGGRRPARRRSS